jgi:alpha-amylase
MSRASFALLLLSLAACGSSGGAAGPDAPAGAGPDAAVTPGGPVTVNVASVFPAGTALKNAMTGASLTVAADGTVTVTPDASGVFLLEKDGAVATPFDWGDVTVYHAIVDRYLNGDPSNDHSYGRQNDGQMEVGTWHGGDWKGLTSKVGYLADLGVGALWISPIVENVHGWVSGGTGDFKGYGYHGYWALDFTKLDKNLGEEADLAALVDAAHLRGLRVLVDVVLNHPGYATGADLLDYLPEVFADKTGAAFRSFDQTATSHFEKWNDLVNYSSDGWKNWWSPTWIRAGFPGFPAGGTTDTTRQLSFLPDFITEGTTPVTEPVLLMRKSDTGFTAVDGATVRTYLVKWQTDWVRKFGFDGFRCDTAKNVDLETWKALKDAGVSALADWKAQNPTKKLDDAPFWMTAEVFPHGVLKDAYYSQGGFDSVINFDFQRDLASILLGLTAGAELSGSADDIEKLYANIAGAIAGDPTFGILSYASSHDTRLNFEIINHDVVRQRHAGTLLLLAPGGVEIFYGDESGRVAGPALSDTQQGTRSDMNFASIDQSIFQHWQKLALFRKRHAAVGAGSHTRLTAPAGSYAFARKKGQDAVVVILTAAKP